MKGKEWFNAPRSISAGIIAAAVMGMAVLPATSEAANTAANATLRNTVTVKYQNAAGTPMADKVASVDIKVTLLATTPTLTLVSQPTATTDANQGIDYTYTITTNANGPDLYKLTNAPSLSADIAAGEVQFYTATAGGGAAINSVTLGATTVAAAATINAGATGSITVLNDDGSYATSLNEIAAGDHVIIGGADFTVTTVNRASGYGTTTISVTNNSAAAVTVAVGDQIRETQTIYLHVVPGTVAAAATTNQTVTVQTAARDNGDVAPATANVQTDTTVLVAQLTVTKYVRNATTPIVGGGTLISINGNDYYTSGVTGKPGQTLEYVVQITAATGGGTAKEVKISDPLTPYTTYTAASMQLAAGITASGASGGSYTGVTFNALNDDDNGGDAGEFNNATKTIYIYAGTGGSDAPAGTGNGTGGLLAPQKTTFGLYQVTIN